MRGFAKHERRWASDSVLALTVVSKNNANPGKKILRTHGSVSGCFKPDLFPSPDFLGKGTTRLRRRWGKPVVPPNGQTPLQSPTKSDEVRRLRLRTRRSPTTTGPDDNWVKGAENGEALRRGQRTDLKHLGLKLCFNNNLCVVSVFCVLCFCVVSVYCLKTKHLF